jgi:hypothetical protein
LRGCPNLSIDAKGTGKKFSKVVRGDCRMHTLYKILERGSMRVPQTHNINITPREREIEKKREKERETEKEREKERGKKNGGRESKRET